MIHKIALDRYPRKVGSSCLLKAIELTNKFLSDRLNIWIELEPSRSKTHAYNIYFFKPDPVNPNIPKVIAISVSIRGALAIASNLINDAVETGEIDLRAAREIAYNVGTNMTKYRHDLRNRPERHLRRNSLPQSNIIDERLVSQTRLLPSERRPYVGRVNSTKT